MAIIKNIKNDGASGTINLHGLISVLTYGDFGGGTATIEASADSNANTIYSEVLDSPGSSQLVVADCSAAGEANYYCQVDYDGPTGLVFVNGSDLAGNIDAFSSFYVGPPITEPFDTLTTNTIFGTPNYVALGTATAGFDSSKPGKFRNLKLYKQLGAAQEPSSDELVAWWPLNTKGFGSITGFIEKDIVGNYDGSGNINEVVGGDQGTWVAIKDKFGNTPSMTSDDSFTLEIGNLALRGNLTGSTDGDLNFAFAVQRGSSNTSATVISNA